MVTEWEYLVVTIEYASTATDYLNGAGENGWELVSVVCMGINLLAFFKRPKS